jgi:hypothetical protein
MFTKWRQDWATAVLGTLKSEWQRPHANCQQNIIRRPFPRFRVQQALGALLDVTRKKYSGTAATSSPMELSLSEVQRWLPDCDGSDSEGSVHSTMDEVADHPPYEEPFANLSLTDYFERNLRRFPSASVLRSHGYQTRDATRRHWRRRAKSEPAAGKKDATKSRKSARRRGLRWGRRRSLITRPTASGMDSRVLHPSAYQDLPSIGTINELTKALNVPDWRERTKAPKKGCCWECILPCSKSAGRLLDRDEQSSMETSLL